MMNKDILIKVVNKFDGTVGYTVPDLNVYRNFYPGETKEISFEELQKLSFVPGGNEILREYLEITDKEAAKQILNIEPEPEYFYTKDDIIRLMKTGSLDEFLDCLDFAPGVVKDMIKDLAVELPLNDVAKREAINQKLNFDVSKAIEIKNTKSEEELEGGKEVTKTTGGRRAPIQKEGTTTAVPSGRRYQPTK